MAETEQSTGNRLNLKRDFLGVSDHKNLGAEGALRAPSMGIHGSENSESDDFALSNSDRHLLHAAAVAENGGSGFILPSAQQTSEANPNSNAAKKKRQDHQQLQLTLAQQARLLSEQLAQQIADMETAFEAEHGDAWREIIANKVMDEVPERSDGESMEDYRKRLEDALIAAMIDEDGNIRPQYLNDPDKARYAQWAQAHHAQNQLQKATPDELEQSVEKARDVHDVLEVRRAQQSREADTTTADRKVDSTSDTESNLVTESGAFAPRPVT